MSQVKSKQLNYPLTGSFTGSFTGSLFGTASFATNSSTSSYSINTVSSSYTSTASYSQTASYANTAQTASYAGSYTLTSSFNSFISSYSTGSFTGSFTGSHLGNTTGTASYAVLAQTASYVNAAQTASYVLNAVSSSFAQTASYSTNGFPFTGFAQITGSLDVSGSIIIRNYYGKNNSLKIEDPYFGLPFGTTIGPNSATYSPGYGGTYQYLNGNGVQNLTINTQGNATLLSISNVANDTNPLVSFTTTARGVNSGVGFYNAIGTYSNYPFYNNKIYGIYNLTQQASEGYTTSSYGIYNIYQAGNAGGGGYATNVYGYYASINNQTSEGAVVTNYYGYYFDPVSPDLSVGNLFTASVNTYGFYQTSSVSNAIVYNYLQGYLGVGVLPTSSLYRLDVSGSSRFTNITSPSITGSLFGTASYALTASYWSGSAPNSVSSSYSISSSYAVSASYSTSSSYSTNSVTASYVLGTVVSSSYSYTASSAVNASASLISVSSSYAKLSSTASSVLGGTSNYLAVWSGSAQLSSSAVYQTASTLVINQTGYTIANPEALYVWQPSTSSFNVISGKGNLNNYLQLNVQNANAGNLVSSDLVATANNGDENNYYVDLGINGQNYNGNIAFGPGFSNDGYVYNVGNDFYVGNYTNGKSTYLFNGQGGDHNPILTLAPNNNAYISSSLVVTGSILANGGITGSLLGTSSYSSQALSSSYSSTASYVQNAISSSYSFTASSAVSSSYSINSATASVLLGGVVSSSYAYTASSAVSSSFSTNAATASVLLGASVSSSYAYTASSAVSSSFSQTASYALNSSTFPYTGSAKISGSLALTGSFSVTGSTVQSGNNTLIGNTVLTGSLTVSGSQGAFPYNVSVYGDTSLNGNLQFLPVSSNINSSISASYIFVSGSTQDLYFSQNGSGYSNVTRLRWLESNLYTGILSGGIISSTPGSTTFSVSSGSGIIVSLNASTASVDPFPTVQYVRWNSIVNTPIQYSGSAKITYLSIKSDGTVNQQTVPIGSTDVTQWDTQIELGVVLHLSGSVSTGVYNAPQVSYGVSQRSDDFFRAFGPLKISGHTLQASGSTLGLIKTSGTAYNNGANYIINPNHPSVVSDPAINTSKIYRYYVSGSTPIIDTGTANAGYTSIDPTLYNNNGTLTAVPTNGANLRYTIQRVFWIPNSPTNAFIVYYGNALYKSTADALNGIGTETFTEAPNTAQNGILIGYAIVAGNETDLTAATIIQGGLFRSINGIGSSNTSPVSNTLAGLSDVSIPGRTSGDLLYYNGSQWINTKSLTGNYSISGTFSTNDGITAVTVTATSFTGSLFGTASYATQAVTASYVLNSISSSYATTASYVTLAQTASYVGSYTLTSSFNSFTSSYNTGSFTGSFTGSYLGNTTGTSSYASQALSSSYSLTASYGANFTASNLLVNGTLTVQTIIAQTITASQEYSSGSNVFGSSLSNYQNFTGSVSITGSLNVNNSSVILSNQTSSMSVATASYASTSVSSSYSTTAANALTASYANATATTGFSIGGSSIYYSTINSSISGVNNLFTLSTGSFTAGNMQYTVYNGPNSRAGQVIASWNGTSVQYTDFSTPSIGDTSQVTFLVSIVSSQVQFNVQTTTSAWKVKSQLTLI